jgi:heme/copper-type cytochrome/quinol oxidase subunit 4
MQKEKFTEASEYMLNMLDGLEEDRKSAIKVALIKLAFSVVITVPAIWLIVSEAGFNWKIALAVFLLAWANNISVSRHG